ncbi:hypothetical protein [Geminicoccus flavidas]|nr:hypothetical protein [Geminicoccus flavidas]
MLVQRRLDGALPIDRFWGLFSRASAGRLDLPVARQWARCRLPPVGK